jgi:glycosyltransferase involved in cell wall biosynthesis
LQEKPPLNRTIAMSFKELTSDALVSVVVPSYNQGEYIRQTIDSILAQDYRPLEIVVVDGASSDDTVQVLQGYGEEEVRWVSEPDNSVVDAVNKGFQRAQGSVIAIQSSDDFYAVDDAISMAMEQFHRDSRVGLVYGDIQKVDRLGRELPTPRLGPYTLKNLLCKRTRIPQESAFFRAEMLSRVGGWREEVSYAADTDLFLRIALNTDVRKLERCLAKRRMHPGQRNDQGRRIIRDYWTMIDTCSALRGMSRELQSAAAAGKFFTAARYSDSEWSKTYYLYRALLACPSACSGSRLPCYPLRVAMSSLKQSLVQACRPSCQPADR